MKRLIIVMAILALAVTAFAADRAGQSWNTTDVQKIRNVGRDRLMPQQGSCTFYTTQAGFEGECGDPAAGDFYYEDWVSSIVGTGGVCAHNGVCWDQNGGNVCYIAGDIIPEINMCTWWESGPWLEPVVLGPYFLGNVDYLVGPNYFSDETLWTFDFAGDAFFCGQYAPLGTIGNMVVSVYDTSSVMIAQTSVSIPTSAASPGAYLGIVCDTTISHIATNDGSSDAELWGHTYYGICEQTLGACCLPDGTCADGMAENECLIDNGGFEWYEELMCSDPLVVCPQPGACCICQDGVHEEMCMTELGGDAFYEGDTCDTVDCAVGGGNGGNGGDEDEDGD
jgi:hypothetical protein